MTKLRVLLVFGGESTEHDISIASASNVYQSLNANKYETTLLYIDTTGVWWLLDKWTDTPETEKATQVVPVPGKRRLVSYAGSMIEVDVVFPVLHGKNGEDGTIQGLLELLHVPYVGSDAEASALCMDKDNTKRLADVPVVPWLCVQAGEDVEKTLGLTGKRKIPAKVAKEVGKGPWFVKPSRSGSSMGVTKVNKIQDMPAAITEALKHDTIAIIEKAVIWREFEVAVLGNAPNHKVSDVAEIIVNEAAEFYDFEQKYSKDGGMEVEIPAKIKKSVNKALCDHAKTSYQNLGCRGLARVDFLVDQKDNVYLNEINTMPGFTNMSVYPMLWQNEKMSQAELVDRLIAHALE